MRYQGKPEWIESLLARLPWTCAEPEHVQSRQGSLRKMIENAIAERDEGAQDLRHAALEELGNEDSRVIVNALSCLFVVGSKEDIGIVESLKDHTSETVGKAARSCLFELRRRDA